MKKTVHHGLEIGGLIKIATCDSRTIYEEYGCLADPSGFHAYEDGSIYHRIYPTALGGRVTKVEVDYFGISGHQTKKVVIAIGQSVYPFYNDHLITRGNEVGCTSTKIAPEGRGPGWYYCPGVFVGHVDESLGVNQSIEGFRLDGGGFKYIKSITVTYIPDEAEEEEIDLALNMKLG